MPKKTQHSRAYDRLLGALRRARESSGLTQQEVARRLGAYASYVSKCESGERRIDVVELAAYCEVYGVKLDELLREAGLL